MFISKSQIKKNFKKIEKIKSRLTDKHGIFFSIEPTEIIVVANAGLANDVKRHELCQGLISFNTHIKDIITPPQCTFSIIICQDIFSSQEILSQMESFIVPTPDIKLRPTVNAFCMYAKNIPQSISSEIVNFHTSKPPGLLVFENFVQVEEENFLVKNFLDFENDLIRNRLKHRSVIHFGYEFNYDNNLVDSSKPLVNRPIPTYCMELLSRLEQKTGKYYTKFNQLTVNIYHPGNGIPSHIDTHSVFSEEIVSVSLNSDVVIEFTNTESLYVDLPARSVCIMSGESRYLWKHGIVARKSDLIFYQEQNIFEKRQRGLRISLTFRLVKDKRHCRCLWPEHCDWQNEEKSNPIDHDNPGDLERQFVHEIYDNIAHHFSSTRHSMWPRVRGFVEKQSPGSIGADVGCGNGKYFPAILATGFLLGMDSSVNLLKIAAETHKIDVTKSNCLQIPYRNGCCDYFICIAVLHHLSTEDRRRRSVEKMVRLLRKTGQGLIYVWAQEQEKNGVKSKYLNKSGGEFKDSVMDTPSSTTNVSLSLPVHTNRTHFTATDVLVPWHKKSSQSINSEESKESVFNRYYHVFQENELERLVLSIGNVKIVDSWYDNGNWAVVLEKL